MDCSRCKQPLEPGARFCRNCGLPVAQAGPQAAPSNTTNNHQQSPAWPPPWPDQPQQQTRPPLQQPPAQSKDWPPPWPDQAQPQQPAQSKDWPPPWPNQQKEAQSYTAPSAPMQPQQQLRLPGQPQSAPQDYTQAVSPAPQWPPSGPATPQDSRQPWPPVQPVSPERRSHVSEVPSPSPMTYSQSYTGANMRPAAVTTQPGRKRRGCLVVGLSTFLFLILLLGVAWIFAIRPYVHDQIGSRVDSKMSSAINAIPPLPTSKIGVTIPVTENIVNTALSFGVAPSDPVQQPVVHFTTNRIRFDFQVQFLFSFPCSFSWTPEIKNKELVATNVSVEGIMGLVMSPEETQQLIDKEFKKALDHIGFEPQKVVVKDGELDLTVQGTRSGPGLPVPIPTTIPSVIPTDIPTALPTTLPTLPIG